MSHELTGVAEPALPDVSEYDAIADLFLSDGRLAPERSDAGARAAPAAEPRSASRVGPLPQAAVAEAEVEGLVVGHLPVMASAWTVQYARTVAAEKGGPVALIRLSEGRVRIDLFGEHSTEQHAPDVQSAIKAIAPKVRAWLLRVGEIAELELAGLAGLSAVTVITGADEAASVAAYRSIKAMANPDAMEMQKIPMLCLAVMGADEGKAGEMESKLRRAAGRYLGRELGPTRYAQKLTGGPTVMLFSDRCDLSPAALVDLIRTKPAPRHEAVPHERIEPRIMPRSEGCEARAGGNAPSCAAADGEVASLLGLRALRFRAPCAQRVEIAVDAQGAPHLVARASAGEQGVSLAVHELLACGAWLRDHAPILAAAAPGLDERADATLHLMTGEPRHARRLLDSGVRVHVVLEVGGNRAAAAIN